MTKFLNTFLAFSKFPWRVTAIAALVFIVGASGALASPPQTIAFQGILKENNAPFSGTADIEFRLYNVASGGSAFWSETHSGVDVAAGYFDVVLGSSVAFPPQASFDRQYWLGIRWVNHGGELPRTPLTSVPYALHPSFAIADTTINPGSIRLDNFWSNNTGTQVTLTYPGPGKIIVEATANIYMIHAAGARNCAILAISRQNNSGGRAGFASDEGYAYVHQDNGAGNDYNFSVPLKAIFSVDAAGTTTYYLNGRRCDPGSTETYLTGATLVATWYPATEN